MRRAPQIEALILSEFHNKKGFTIIEVIQSQNHITSTQFTIYSELILYREELCGRLLVSEFMDKYYLIGVPSLSVNVGDKNVYERAKYLYAVSVLVYKERYLDEIDHSIYKEIAVKVAHFFKFVEETSNAVYYNMENKQYIHYLLSKVYKSINSGEECVLSHFSTCYTIINLNRSPFQRDNKEIKKSYVPITFLSEFEIDNVQSEIGKQLLKYAKIGDYNIRKICELEEDEKSVYRFYSKGMEMGVVFMVDMFSLENKYCLTPAIHKYVGNRSKEAEEELEEICNEVTLKKLSSNSFVFEQIKITPNVLLYLYFQMSRKESLKKIIDSNLELVASINIFKWVRISEILGIIRRIYEKFAIDYNREETQEFEFISQESLKTYMVEPRMKGWEKIETDHERGSDSSGGGGFSIREECERMNSLFNSHLKNMDTIDEICVSMKISKSVLLELINFNNQRILKIVLVTE